MLHIKNSRIKTAIHEAGHAAAQIWFEHPFEYVTIIPDNDSLGHVRATMNPRLEELFYYDSPTAEDERYIKHEFIILMAGGAAEQKFSDLKGFPSGCWSDYKSFALLCERLGINDPVFFKAYKAYLKAEARLLFKKEEKLWEFVTKLAELLIQKETVPFTDCEKLYESTVGEYFDEGGTTKNDKEAFYAAARKQ